MNFDDGYEGWSDPLLGGFSYTDTWRKTRRIKRIKNIKKNGPIE